MFTDTDPMRPAKGKGGPKARRVDDVEVATVGRREAILDAVVRTAESMLEGQPWREGASQLLRALGEATQVSRVYLYQRREADGELEASLPAWWQAPDAPPAPEDVSFRESRAGYARWLEFLERGEIFVATVSELPPQEREFLAPWGVLSFALVPVFLGQRWWGQIGLSDCREERRWSAAEIDGIRTAAGLLGALIYREEAEAALRESEQRFRVLVENVPGVVYVSRYDPQYSLQFVSETVQQLTGYSAREFTEGSVVHLDLIHPDDRLGVEPLVKAALAERRPFQLVYRLQHLDGRRVWIEERGQGVYGEDGLLRWVEGTLVDVTSRKKAEEQLVHNALHDSLTGLPNRVLFTDRLGVALRRAQRQQQRPLAVLFIDLDQFKLVNDSLGHFQGDQLLKAIATRLERCLRPGDTVARFGGDEFAVLMDDLDDMASAVSVAERIRTELAAPFQLGDREVFTGACIGIAPWRPSYRTAEEVLRDADIAMYRAKSLGRSRHVVFGPEMRSLPVARLELEQQLRRALERGETTLHYQPLVDLEDRRVVGFEALLRWRHPQRGLLGPDHFLGAAVETATLIPMGNWVLREACRQAAAWTAAHGPFSMHVNLHGSEFAHPDLVRRVRDALAQADLPAQHLTLELTEHVVMEDPERAAQVMAELRALGVGIGLDDFGKGNSSLGHLHRFPLTALKLDRDLVVGAERDSRGREILRAVLSLGRALDVEPIAEGLEHARQIPLLLDLGCRLAQGFVFAHPQPAEQAEGFLRAGALQVPGTWA